MVSNIKFGGMASGLDTDKMIKDLMKVERMPLDKLKQQKQLISWKRDEYRDMNSSLTSIRSIIDKMRFSSGYNKQAASSSNTGVVAATTTSTAVSGSYTIEVDKLASSALMSGSTTDINPKDKINVTGQFTVEGPNGKSTVVNVTADSTYDSVMKQVNSSGIGVNMSYDSINKRFMLGTTSTGDTAAIKVTNDNANIAAGIFKLEVDKSIKGTNAVVAINGTSMELQNNALEFNGIKFDIKGVSATAVTVQVSRDTDNIASQIKEFVNQYNQLVDKINTKTTTIPSKGYAPLTDEQREAMTETQINLWETKAKAGILYKDDILTSGLSKIRSSLLAKVEGLPENYNTLSDIGITFKAYQKGQPGELGKLMLDEKKLQDAVLKDPDAVMNLFTKSSSLDPKDKNYKSETGYAERIYTDLNNQINKIIKTIGTTTLSDTADSSQLGESIRNINSRMSTLENRMKTVENRYYKQFTAMETTLQRLNSQGSWLSQQLGRA
ncbi:flagellar filament capping protein FliD [Paenibacillus sp. GbtcB18]|uniref:flagellar filament capping protein FliD n=1 Tax=Paenibacillus sp. GbtcB18 TaxID=2824763 RepID=UPI001C30DB29|nr:flagellar filament capping protein FliD [Paenibacillus sp. GbtcB18]